MSFYPKEHLSSFQSLMETFKESVTTIEDQFQSTLKFVESEMAKYKSEIDGDISSMAFPTTQTPHSSLLKENLNADKLPSLPEDDAAHFNNSTSEHFVTSSRKVSNTSGSEMRRTLRSSKLLKPLVEDVVDDSTKDKNAKKGIIDDFKRPAKPIKSNEQEPKQSIGANTTYVKSMSSKESIGANTTYVKHDGKTPHNASPQEKSGFVHSIEEASREAVLNAMNGPARITRTKARALAISAAKAAQVNLSCEATSLSNQKRKSFEPKNNTEGKAALRSARKSINKAVQIQNLKAKREVPKDSKLEPTSSVNGLKVFVSHPQKIKQNENHASKSCKPSEDRLNKLYQKSMEACRRREEYLKQVKEKGMKQLERRERVLSAKEERMHDLAMMKKFREGVMNEGAGSSAHGKKHLHVAQQQKQVATSSKDFHLQKKQVATSSKDLLFQKKQEGELFPLSMQQHEIKFFPSKEKGKERFIHDPFNTRSYDLTLDPEDRPLLPSKSVDDYGLDDVNSEDSSDDETKPKKAVPLWAKDAARHSKCDLDSEVTFSQMNTFFQSKKTTPDLTKIFLGISPRNLMRRSSAVWH